MPSILVLGARHLGGAILDRFAELGYDLASVSRTEETASAVRERHPGALAYAADASDPEALARVAGEVHERRGLDVLVHALQPGARGPFGGGRYLEDAPPDALAPYAEVLLPSVHNAFRIGGRIMAPQGRGTILQVTGGSALRGSPGKGAWAGAAAAVRAMTQAAAAELREEGVHVALLVVDAMIESEKTRAALEGYPEDASTTQEDVVAAAEYLVGQSPRAWTHELQITPRGDRWIP